ncbi:MAG: hypothetical protein Q7U53_14050 [Anaerolineaceae bacterium]|nr:hypothetical protein [Anaerolineaceae bacterium]
MPETNSHKVTNDPITRNAGYKQKISWCFHRIISFFSEPIIALLIAALLIYGFFIPFLGFYWDDLMIQWIAQVLGKTGLVNYFSTNRPVMGFLYPLTTSLVGDEPWRWQVFAIFWRWLAAYGFYCVCKELWKDKTPALLAGLIFLSYPGFAQQFIATIYSHFFLVLSAFFFSLFFSLKAALSQNRKRFWLLTGAALVLSAVNLFSMEYFFMLELLRPLLLWMVLQNSNETRSNRQRLLLVLRRWWPYLLVFLAAVIWRTLLFDYQTTNYEVGLLDLLRENPLNAVLTLAGTVFKDLWTTFLGVWQLVVQFPGADFGQRAWLIVIIFSLAVLVFSAVVIFWTHKKDDSKYGKSIFGNSLWIALVAGLLAGVPFWLTQIPIGLSFPNDRFTLPFVIGVAIFWVSVVMLIPVKRWIQYAFLILLVSLSAGYQLRSGILFQRDWEQQSRFFWQMVWRIPALEKDTIIFAHELPLRYFSDNSLTGGLNWIYAEPQMLDDSIPYVLYYPTVRVGLAVKSLNPDEAVKQNLLVGDFEGNTSQSIALFYQPPACLRVLDPELETDNWMVPLQVRETIHLTDWNVILDSPQHVLPSIYSPEPDHQWCYYFQKADLARQYRDWEEVVRLGEIAFNLDDQPNDPAERFPFIEGYTHQELWTEAVEMSGKSAAITPVIHPAMCRLWQRIERETPDSNEKSIAMQSMNDLLQCEMQP